MPDVLSDALQQTLKEEITSNFHKLKYTHTHTYRRGENISNSFNKACITLIPKADKDVTK